MTDLDRRHPEFTIALRGYDRAQVDEYVGRLQQLVSESETRAQEAEAGAKLGAHATIGPRVSEIFELAAAEAGELRESIEREVMERLSQSRGDAKELVADAHREANKITERTTREHEAMLDEYEEERERIRAQVSQLEQRRHAVLQELKRLHHALGLASGIAVAPAEPAELNAPAARPEPELIGAADETEPLEVAASEGETMELPRRSH